MYRAWSHGLFLGKNSLFFLCLKTMESLRYFFLVFLTLYYPSLQYHLINVYAYCFNFILFQQFSSCSLLHLSSLWPVFCSLPGSFSVKHGFHYSILFLQQQWPQQTPKIFKDEFQCPPWLSTLPCPTIMFPPPSVNTLGLATSSACCSHPHPLWLVCNISPPPLDIHTTHPSMPAQACFLWDRLP